MRDIEIKFSTEAGNINQAKFKNDIQNTHKNFCEFNNHKCAVFTKAKLRLTTHINNNN